jgi:hypothetical protein
MKGKPVLSKALRKKLSYWSDLINVAQWLLAQKIDVIALSTNIESKMLKSNHRREQKTHKISYVIYIISSFLHTERTKGKAF